jgi:tight adherence protein B
MRLEEKVKSLTAENRMSARMMGLMPAVVAGIYYMIEPEFMSRLVNDPWGLLLGVIAIAFWAAGFLWIRKIVSFDI